MLGLVVTDALYRAHPDLSEGQLAKLRAAVVNTRALADVARGRSASAQHLRLGRGEETTGGRNKYSILADTLEALIGAVYLERGLEAAARRRAPAVRPADGRAPPRIGAGLDWKTSLQELSADARRSACPSTSSRTTGPDHAKTFTAAVRCRRPSATAHGTGRHQEGGRAAGRRDAPAAQAPPRRRRRPASSSIASQPCPSSPRSRSSAAASSRRSSAAPSRGRGLHPRAVRRHLAGADDFAALPRPGARHRRRRRGKYLWLPLDSGTTRSLGAPRHERPAARAAAGRARRDAPAGRGSRFTDGGRGAALRRPAHVRRPRGRRRGGGGPARRRSRTSPATRSTRLSTTTRSSPRCARRRTGIKRALLDQTLVSGVGNIYADEALWRAQLHGARPDRRR